MNGKLLYGMVLALWLVMPGPGMGARGGDEPWGGALQESRQLAKQKRYDQALERAREALALAEGAVGSRDPRLVPLLRQVGSLLMRSKEYDRAIPVLERAREILEPPPGEAPPADLPTVLGELGRARYGAKRLAEAEESWQRAVALREVLEGGESPRLVWDLLALGRAARAREGYGEAEELIRRAQGIRMRHLDPAHGHLAEGWMELSRVYELQHRWEEAMGMTIEAIAVAQAGVAKGDAHAQRRLEAYQKRLVSLQRQLEGEGVAPARDAVGGMGTPLVGEREQGVGKVTGGESRGGAAPSRVGSGVSPRDAARAQPPARRSPPAEHALTPAQRAALAGQGGVVLQWLLSLVLLVVLIRLLRARPPREGEHTVVDRNPQRRQLDGPPLEFPPEPRDEPILNNGMSQRACAAALAGQGGGSADGGLGGKMARRLKERLVAQLEEAAREAARQALASGGGGGKRQEKRKGGKGGPWG